MKHVAVFFLLCCLPLSSVVHAAEADRAKTMELFRVMNIESVMDEQIEMIAPIMINMVKSSHGKLPDRAVDIIFEEAQAMIKEAMPKIMDGFAQVYEKHFTPEEITALVAAYKIPVMQKLLQVQVILQQEAIDMSGSIVEQESMHLLHRIELRLEEEYPYGLPEEQ